MSISLESEIQPIGFIMEGSQGDAYMVWNKYGTSTSSDPLNRKGLYKGGYFEPSDATKYTINTENKTIEIERLDYWYSDVLAEKHITFGKGIWYGIFYPQG